SAIRTTSAASTPKRLSLRQSLSHGRGASRRHNLRDPHDLSGIHPETTEPARITEPRPRREPPA
ncbi:hypothetical protein ACW4FQ_30585, partial [Escherichia coli]